MPKTVLHPECPECGGTVTGLEPDPQRIRYGYGVTDFTTPSIPHKTVPCEHWTYETLYWQVIDA